MTRGDLTDQEWARLEPLLPTNKRKRGRPYVDHRRVLNGILWIARTGAPWRDLPERYGSWKTCHSRLTRWQKDALWDRLLQKLQAEAEHQGLVIWAVAALDSTTVRAHQHAAGARRSPAARAEKGGSRGRFRGIGPQPRRADHQAALDHGRAVSSVGAVSLRGPAAR